MELGETVGYREKLSVLAPNFNNLIPKRAIKQHTLSQVLTAWRWVNAINIALTVQVLTEYLQFGIWWKSCTCSSRSLINTSGGPHCLAPILANQPTMPISLEQSFLLEENLQHLGSIAWCKFFVWLAINNWCWTVDRLAKRGLPHPAAWPSCDQAEDTIQHVLTLCVFSRASLVTNSSEVGSDYHCPTANSKLFLKLVVQCSQRSTQKAPESARLSHHIRSLGNLKA